MSSGPDANKPHARATTWTITLIVAVPLLYLLSVDPLHALFVQRPRWDTYVVPKWLDGYSLPYLWIYDNFPSSREPMRAYSQFCHAMLTPKPAPPP